MRFMHSPFFLSLTMLMVFGWFNLIIDLEATDSGPDPRLNVNTGVPSRRPRAIKSVASDSPEYNSKPANRKW